MKELILGVLLGLPRAPDSRTDHLPDVAAAIDSASLRATCGAGWEGLGCKPVWRRSRRSLVAGLITIGYFESGFYARIQRNECRIRLGECDGGQSRTYWQMKRTGGMGRWYWQNMIGEGWYPTTLAAYASSVRLGTAENTCKSIEGAISMYARGNSCIWRPAKSRWKTWMRIEQKLVLPRG